MRLDRLLFERGFVSSRSRAQALIMAGKVFVDGKRAEKAGQSVNEDAEIEIKGPDHPYVSRGGIKLEAAIKEFDIDCNSKVVLDVGASTGGFTDCLIQNGARRVYALDVGFGQLAWKLRNDERVINLERMNIRHLDPALIPEPLDMVTIDCSFISLRLILPKIHKMVSDGKAVICLIKPQFEVEKGEVGKGGVVRDRERHEVVLRRLKTFAQQTGFSPKGLIASPIKGPKGNCEFLLYLVRGKYTVTDLEEAIQKALNP